MTPVLVPDASQPPLDAAFHHLTPDEVVAALARGHLSPNERGVFLERYPMSPVRIAIVADLKTPFATAQMVEHDEDPLVRATLMLRPDCPKDLVANLARTMDDSTALLTTTLPGYSTVMARVFSQSPNPIVRVASLAGGWMKRSDLKAFARDPHPDVRVALLWADDSDMVRCMMLDESDRVVGKKVGRTARGKAALNLICEVGSVPVVSGFLSAHRPTPAQLRLLVARKVVTDDLGCAGVLADRLKVASPRFLRSFTTEDLERFLTSPSQALRDIGLRSLAPAA